MKKVTEQDYELLSQYLDGELPEDAMRLLEQRLAAEPSLASALGSLQTLQSQLQDVHSGLHGQPVPERIVTLLKSSQSGTVPFIPRRRAAGWGMALAASLVIAVSATLLTPWTQQSSRPAGSPGIDELLAQALEYTPSRGSGWETLDDGRLIRPVLSFQSHSGAWCREYVLAGDDGHWHGVACRSTGGWDAKAIASSDAAGSPDEYRPAASTDTDKVADFIALNAADIPLDAAQEADLIARKWQ